MTFPIYPIYKKTGIEWPKEAPPHWPPIRLKFAVRLNPSKSEIAKIDRSEEVSFLPMEAIGEDGSISLEHTRPIAEVETGYTYFRDGDVTIAKITPCFENGKGAVIQGLLGGIGFGTTELIVARPIDNKVCPEFLHSIFNSDAFRGLGQASMYGAGGQKRVPDDFVRNFRAPIPPLSEQQAIQNFIDSETGKIDALVEEQKRLIELLKEKRKAVISQAVTKGLEPNVPLKESGVEWLGEVPRHWHIKRLKYSITNCRNGIWGADSRGDENDIPCIRVADFDRLLMRVHLENPTIRNVLPNERHQRLLTKGNLLLEKSGGGDLQPVGFVVLYDDSASAVCSNFIARVELAPGMHPGYWRYVHSTLYSARVNTRSINQTSGIQNLDQDRYFNELAPFPPPDEQKKIEEFIDLQTRKLDTLIAEANRVIALLSERRSTLISAAVTGQIDVRQLEAA